MGCMGEMKITLKLFTFLGRFLPSGAEKNQIVLDVREGISAGQVLNELGVPRAECKILMINGLYTAPTDADGAVLKPSDVLAVWPQSTG